MAKTTSRPIYVFKYGGNAMLNDTLKRDIITNISNLKKRDIDVVIVHGGGPFIKDILSIAEVNSEFIDGQRVTTPEALKYVEMALKGNVNGDLVRLLNAEGRSAVGMSGKDGKTVIAKKRMHHSTENGQKVEKDLGRVGDVDHVNTELIELLLDNDYIPVLTCVATDKGGNDYNINADMFAGHIAGALKAEQFIVMTDVDGLLTDINDPGSLIRTVNEQRIADLTEKGVIKGGMLPKMESCLTAVKNGAVQARIINGTKPDQIQQLAEETKPGTSIESK